MTILANNTCLGRLRIVEVYDDYEGPKFFLVKNQFKQQFVCYWVDEREDGALGWLYMQISDEKLRSLVNGEVDAHEAFSNPEQGVYLAYTPVDSSSDTAVYYEIADLDESLIPPADVYIEPSAIESCDDVESNWVYELSIKTKSSTKKSPITLSVSDIFAKFQVVLESLMRASARQDDPKLKRRYTTYPINAEYGSFAVRFGSDSSEYATTALEKLSEIIKADEEKIEDAAKAMLLSPYDLRELLDTVQRNRLKIEVRPRFYSSRGSSGDYFIDGDLTGKIEALANTETPIIPSIKMPQANDIRKVERVVELVASGKPYTYEDFNDIGVKLNSKRQVRYYEDAAYALDLLTKNYMLTSAGKFFLSRKTKKVRYQVLADRFESSDFGWGWIRWSNVSSMAELDPESAVNFVMDSVPELGEDTAKRRATTLVKWLEDLLPYHRDYDD